MDGQRLRAETDERRPLGKGAAPRALPAEQAVLDLQGRAGNRTVASLIQRLSVQRHAPGAALPDGEQIAADIGSALGGATAVPPIAQDGGGAASSGATAEALPAATGTAAEVSEAKKEGAAYTKQITAPGAGGRAMSLGGAEKILQGEFGDVHKIVPGSVEVLKDRAAAWAKYDEVCMAASITNPSTGKPWAKGDAKARIPGLEGFAWNGTVYVNGVTPLVTATAHEILHNNTAGDFRSKVGEAINEGTTEMLAKQALTAAGVPTAAARTAYPSEVAIVEKLAAFVGRDLLTKAYFNGSTSLVTGYETARGAPGSWAALKTACDTLDLAKVTPLLAKVPAPAAPAVPTPAGGAAGGP